uniref:Solute carrier family 48 member 1 n=2 Tax=Boreoeutheria TaxID=1437010 RepID=A0A8C8WVX8_PANLE
MLKQSPPPACVHVFPGPAQAQKSSPRTGPGTRLVTRRPPNQPGGPTASLGGAPAPRGEVPGAGGLRPGRALCRRRGGRAGGGARGGRRLPAPGSRGSPPRPRPCTCDCRGARPPRPATAAPMAPSRLQLGLRAAYSGLSSVAGFSIFLVWTVVYRQPGTAAMGGLAGVLALWVLVTHVMYMQDYWRTWLKGLRGFFFVGVLFSAVSIATLCTFLASQTPTATTSPASGASSPSSGPSCSAFMPTATGLTLPTSASSATSDPRGEVSGPRRSSGPGLSL